MGQAQSGETFPPLPWGSQAPWEQPCREEALGKSLKARGIPGIFLSITSLSLHEPLIRSWGLSWGR